MNAIRIAAVAAVALCACTDLGDVERDRCGNGVIEPLAGEDCDGSEACGAAGTEQACRIVCATNVADACPGRAVCGIDGICHAPGGTFSLATSVAWTTPHLLVADTSGDGYPELVGVGAQHVDVRLGGRDLGYSALPSIPSPPLTGAPRAADLEGDGDADVAIPVGGGVFSLSGSSATVLDPFFYNSFAAPAAGRIVAVGVEFADLIAVPLIAAGDSESGQSVLVFAGLESSGAFFPPGRTVDELVGETLPVGQLIDNSLNVRTVALAFATGRAIALYDTTVVDLDTLTITPRSSVMLPLNTEIRAGAWFADFDGDGHVDLVASVDTGGVEGLAVAWGNGSGGVIDSNNVANQASVVWRADRDQDGQAGVDGPLAPVMIGQVTDNLVILGDENDADVIAAAGLYTTSCLFRNQCALYLLRPSGRSWTGAVVADVNHDDRPDVAAFARGQTGIDLLLNTTTTLLFNDASVASAGAVERILTGDFNGDTITDLAYVDTVPGVAFTDALSVAFGQDLVPPGPPVFMGSIGEYVAGGGLLTGGGAGEFDFVDDVVLVTDRQVGTATRRGAAILFGSTSRRLTAPLLPASIPRGNRPVNATRVDDVFPLDGNGDPYTDLVVVTTTGYGADPSAGTGQGAPVLIRHARFFAGQSDGQADEGDFVELTNLNLNLDGARWLGADVTGNERDEAIGLRGDGGLVLVRLDGTCTGPACLTLVAPPMPVVVDPVAFRAADLDGDGDLDLIAMMRNRSDTGMTARTAAVVVWWNETGFAPARTQVISGDVLDALSIDLDRDGPRELILLERRAGDVVLAAARLSGGAYGPAEAIASATDGVALDAADLDGDALEDLVVVTGVERNVPRELAIYTQSETRISAEESP